jgi:dTDP-4-dehydrorhamnose reductase
MRVLVTGAAGMLGGDLVPLLNKEHTVAGVDVGDFDITDSVATFKAVSDSRAEAVIHCAAFTDVERAETEREAALAVNATGSRNIARGCRECGARLYLISTDFVFDGSKGSPYVESDQPNPLSEYGRGKLEGEKLARQELGGMLSVVRTAWLYGAAGDNFLTKLLQFAARGNPVRVVDDQYGSPTWTVALAECLARMLRAQAASPVYHAACAGSCSRFEMAVEWFRLLGLDSVEVVPVSSSAFPSAVSRPENSSMTGAALVSEGIEVVQPWREALARFAEAGGKEKVQRIMGG